MVGMVGLIGAGDSQNSNDEVEKVVYRDSNCMYDHLDGVLRCSLVTGTMYGSMQGL